MPLPYSELDRVATPMGDLVLRRRRDPSLDADVYEVKLGDEFLMSSLFTVTETELARLALARCEDKPLDVVVGGLGLGYTAAAVLDDDRVRSVTVLDALEAVVAWHRAGLVPLGRRIATDPRATLVHLDFFGAVRDATPFAPAAPPLVDAIVVDIDHTPRHHLHPTHADFYEEDGLRRLASRLRPGGVFALWSDARPDDAFLTVLGRVFRNIDAAIVAFSHLITGDDCTATIYLATNPQPG